MFCQHTAHACLPVPAPDSAAYYEHNETAAAGRRHPCESLPRTRGPVNSLLDPRRARPRASLSAAAGLRGLPAQPKHQCRGTARSLGSGPARTLLQPKALGEPCVCVCVCARVCPHCTASMASPVTTASSKMSRTQHNSC